MKEQGQKIGLLCAYKLLIVLRVGRAFPPSQPGGIAARQTISNHLGCVGNLVGEFLKAQDVFSRRLSSGWSRHFEAKVDREPDPRLGLLVSCLLSHRSHNVVDLEKKKEILDVLRCAL